MNLEFVRLLLCPCFFPVVLLKEHPLIMITAKLESMREQVQDSNIWKKKKIQSVKALWREETNYRELNHVIIQVKETNERRLLRSYSLHKTQKNADVLLCLTYGNNNNKSIQFRLKGTKVSNFPLTQQNQELYAFARVSQRSKHMKKEANPDAPKHSHSEKNQTHRKQKSHKLSNREIVQERERDT